MVSLPLVSVEDLLAAMPVAANNSVFNDRLISLSKVATGQIETATNRQFTRQAYVRSFRTIRNGSYTYDFANASNEDGVMPTVRPVRYVLAGYPVVGSPEVRYDTYRTFADESIIDPSLYLFDAATGVLELLFSTIEGRGMLQVSYTAGYEANDVDTPAYLTGVPEDLKLACLTQVQFLFTKLSPDNIGVRTERGSKSVEPAFFTANGGLCMEAASMVAHYRQPLTGLS